MNIVLYTVLHRCAKILILVVSPVGSAVADKGAKIHSRIARARSLRLKWMERGSILCVCLVDMWSITSVMNMYMYEHVHSIMYMFMYVHCTCRCFTCIHCT